MRLARPAATTAALTAIVAAQVNFNLSCYNGLYVIGVRGSGEGSGFGIVGPVAQGVVERVPGSVSRWLPYTAGLANYTSSEHSGVGNLTHLIKEYVDKCPCRKIAVVGLSQGAQVIADTLIGPSYPSWPAFGVGSGIGQKYVDAIGAAVLQGDPSYIPGLPIDTFNNATKGGYFLRNNSDNWSKYGLTGKVQSLCYANDTFCDSGKLGVDSIIIHASYTRTYGNQSADFVASVWKESPKNTCSESGSVAAPYTNRTCSAGTQGDGSNGTAGSNSTTRASKSNNTSTSRNDSTGIAGRHNSSTSAGSPASTNPVPASSGVKTGISTVLVLAALTLVL